MRDLEWILEVTHPEKLVLEGTGLRKGPLPPQKDSTGLPYTLGSFLFLPKPLVRCTGGQLGVLRSYPFVLDRETTLLPE